MHLIMELPLEIQVRTWRGWLIYFGDKELLIRHDQTIKRKLKDKFANNSSFWLVQWKNINRLLNQGFLLYFILWDILLQQFRIKGIIE